jgi:hypothetical protein
MPHEYRTRAVPRHQGNFPGHACARGGVVAPTRMRECSPARTKRFPPFPRRPKRDRVAPKPLQVDPVPRLRRPHGRGPVPAATANRTVPAATASPRTRSSPGSVAANAKVSRRPQLGRNVPRASSLGCGGSSHSDDSTAAGVSARSLAPPRNAAHSRSRHESFIVCRSNPAGKALRCDLTLIPRPPARNSAYGLGHPLLLPVA